MSAWYVFASLGFYPVCPVAGEYILASPVFDKAVLHLPGRKTFTIKTLDQAPENVFVKSVTLNGEAYNDIVLRFEDLAKGGEMVFAMSPARPGEE